MDFIKKTIDLAKANVEEGGRPFACIIVRNNEILAEGVNQVAQTKDPTAHAEILAIRKAATTLQTEHYEGCHIYCMAHACPMCLAAMYYCSPERVIFIITRDDYAPFLYGRSQILYLFYLLRRVSQTLDRTKTANEPSTPPGCGRSLSTMEGTQSLIMTVPSHSVLRGISS